MRKLFVTAFVVIIFCALPCISHSQDLWELALDYKDVLTVSTLFTAQNVRDLLSDRNGLDDAVEWCKQTGVTKVFIESYRSRYYAESEALLNAKNRFLQEGFEVSGCVTTTQVGKITTGWDRVSCYTNEGTQDELQRIFEYTAAMFDEIMIDDFLFTDCECEECITACGETSWDVYRNDLMVEMSRERILKPAKAVNPNVKIINKFPQWYDRFHNRGYEVLRQTADFDKIWVGTETRDYDDEEWGGTVQYEAYFIMRWLGDIGGAKTGGGWFDPYGTTEDTYVEQARQSVLADAKNILLFCYGSLLGGTGPANVRKFRTELPGLFELAKLVRDKPLRGILAVKPPNSDPYEEPRIFDFAGMIGLPLIPAAGIDTDAQSAFFSVHALKDPNFKEKLQTMLDNRTPVLITDGLARRLSGIDLEDRNITILEVGGVPESLLEMSQEEIETIRNRMLAPLRIRFSAPNKVALYLIGWDRLVIENFNDEPVDAILDFSFVSEARVKLILPEEGSVDYEFTRRHLEFRDITPRTLVAIEY